MKRAILILAATILLSNCSSDEPEIQDPSLIALQKIYDNSGGKGDATAIIMEDLKAIGLKNLEDARLKQYQRAIAAKTDFSNPSKVSEVQALIISVNNYKEPKPQGSSLIALQKIYDNSGGKGDSSAITMEDFKTIGVEDAEYTRLLHYQNAISTKKDFSNPATVGEVQEIIDSSNDIIQKIIGKWSLVEIRSSWFLLLATYNFRDIVWDFKEDKVIVTIPINLDGVYREYFPYLIDGEYTYSLSSHGVIIYLDDSGESISLFLHHFIEDDDRLDMSTGGTAHDGGIFLYFSKITE